MARTGRPVGLVTGAANGIGRAIARSLLATGWRIGVVDLPGSGLGRTFARDARSVIVVEGDVADEATSERVVAEVLARFGRLDGLVSNAGISRNKPLAKLTLEEWRRVIDVNLTAAFLLARAAEQPLRAAGGAIVTVAST